MEVRITRESGPPSVLGAGRALLVAEDSEVADGLLLSSYPLHPPGRPERMRTEHLPEIAVPTLIVVPILYTLLLRERRKPHRHHHHDESAA